MAGVPSKHGRDQALDFQGFLNDLQDWELSFKEKDKKIKQQDANTSNPTGEKFKPSGRASNAGSSSSGLGQYDFLKNYSSTGNFSSSFMDEESPLDANSEKEQGNEYFKQQKFNEAIDCYSRSIALSPTSVAHANRAMAYLKIRRHREAEEDCTEALNLDDRYIKAYSRRATARKELGKLKEAMDDAEFALRLEPKNQELKKQYADIKSLLEKDILQKATGAMKSSVQEVLKTANLEAKAKTSNVEAKVKMVSSETKTKMGDSEAKTNGNLVHPASSSQQTAGKSVVEELQSKEKDKQGPKKTLSIVEKIESKSVAPRSRSDENEAETSDRNGTQISGLRSHAARKQELKASLQELAARAASRAMAEASKNIKAPNSAYEFENSWRGFSGDHALQTQLLKVMPPSSLPRIFKNALTAPMLIDIIKCVAAFFTEDTDLAFEYIENLTKVPRFSMLVMCFSSTEKSELMKIWDEVFCNEATPIERADLLDNLRSKYCLNRCIM